MILGQGADIEPVSLLISLLAIAYWKTWWLIVAIGVCAPAAGWLVPLMRRRAVNKPVMMASLIIFYGVAAFLAYPAWTGHADLHGPFWIVILTGMDPQTAFWLWSVLGLSAGLIMASRWRTLPSEN